MRKIEILVNKTLKLTNVLSYAIVDEDKNDMDGVAFRMDNYIRSKGLVPVGPIIQQVEISLNSNDFPVTEIKLLRQANGYINNIEYPYCIQSVLRVKKCLYAHYIGPEDRVSVVYDKINVIAFEQNIDLKSKNYTIYVKELESGDVVVDVFVEMC